MTKVITPPKDTRKPYTQSQLLKAIKAILCDGSRVIVPNDKDKNGKKP